MSLQNTASKTQHSTFPRYDRYKDSGVEWLGEVPEHWEARSIRGILKERGETNEGFKTYNVLSVMKDRGVVLYADKGNVGNKMSEDISDYKLVQKGDLVINKMNAVIGSLGISNYDGALSKVYFVMQPRYTYVNNRYYGYIFQIRDFQKSLCKISYGIMELRESISFNEFKKLPLPLPPKPEQDRIVAFLDEKTAQIDALIAKKERQIQLLEEQKAIRINQAVTRGLNPGVKLKDSGIEWIGEIPEHWEAEKARHLFVQEERPTSRTDDVVTCFRDGQVTLRSKRRTEGFTFAILEQGYQGVEPGDLVIHGMDAFAGAIGVSEDRGKCTPEYIVLNPYAEGIDNEYFALHLREMANSGYIHLICPSVRERAPRFRFPKLKGVRLTKPPLEEQRAIVAFVTEAKANTSQVIDIFLRDIQSLKNLRSTLIAHAVTGKIKS